jgi:hypothetical protein
MPIATHKVGTCSPKETKTPYTTPKKYKSIALEHRKIDLTSLAACAEGSPWLIDEYFNQSLDVNDAQHYQDAHLSPSYQAYTNIKGLTIYVTDGLSSDISPETHENQTRGTGLVYGGLRLNVGDEFVAKMADGRYLFLVVDIELRSYRNKPAQEIQYSMVCPITDQHPNYLDLLNKTRDTLVVTKDFGTASCSGNSKIVPEAEKDISDTLASYYDGLLETYLRLFLDADTDTFIYEEDKNKYHDRYLTNFIEATFLMDRSRKEVKIRNIAKIESERRFSTLWDLLLDPRFLDVIDITKHMHVLPNRHFDINQSTINIRYLTIEYLIVHIGEDLNGTLTTLYDIFGGAKLDLPSLFQDTVPMQGGSPISIKPVLMDNFYVLSEGFYTCDVACGVSALELFVKKYIKGESIDHKELLHLTKQFKSWGMLEKFYYVPIVLLL